MAATRPRRWRWAVAGVVLLAMALWFAARVPDVPAATLRAAYTTPASRFLTLEPGLSVHVRDEGPAGGLPVVLLHGSNASLQTWEPWVRALTAAGYRVVSFDFPGHGLTGPSPTRGYGRDAYVRLVGEVADTLHLTRFVVGGNSMGGGVAAAFASAHPERVAGLILVDAAGAPMRGDAKLPIGFRIARTPVLRDLVEDITPRSMIEMSLKQTLADPAKVTQAMIDRYWLLLRYPGNRAATIDRFAAGYEPLDAAALARFPGPVLILWGANDRLIPVASADWFKRLLPSAEVHVLPAIGHIPMEEDVAGTLAAVEPFLARVAAQTTAPRPAR